MNVVEQAARRAAVGQFERRIIRLFMNDRIPAPDPKR